MKKVLMLLFLCLTVFTFVGCDEINGLFDDKDEQTTLEISDIDTKEEAVTFLINKVKSWKYAKAEVTALSFFSFPIEANFDFSNKKGYAVEYTDGTNQTINRSYYVEGTNVFAYDRSKTPEYEIFDAQERFIDFVDIQSYLDLLDQEAVNIDFIDLEGVTFAKDENSMTLAFSMVWYGSTYAIEIVYKRLSVRLVLQDLATVTFEPTETNYFDTFTFDKTPYQN
jgi:hypothetical protein